MATPDRAVKPRDMVIDVNGCDGDVVQMVSLSANAPRLEVTDLRPTSITKLLLLPMFNLLLLPVLLLRLPCLLSMLRLLPAFANHVMQGCNTGIAP